MNTVKLSIIIPTKDRYKYLLQLIPMLDSYELKDTELVIEDNSSDNTKYKDFMSSYTGTMPIVYNNVKEQLPIKKNIDNAIKHSHGKYVCIIGDDDSVTPLIIDCVNWMETSDVESVRQSSEITYKWPSYADESKVSSGGYLMYKGISSDVEKINPEKAALDVISNGFGSLGQCPCVYQGIVRRDCLNRLYSIGGTFIPGPSPDMANAMALSFVLNNHFLVHYPVILSGGSEYQGGKSEKVKSWVQPLENIPFISDEDKKKWDKRIPYFWCAQTVWPESGLKGLEYVSKSELAEVFNVERNLARCAIRVGRFNDNILSCSTHKKKAYYYFIRIRMRKFLSIVKWRVLGLFHIDPNSASAKRIGGLNTISDAVDFLMKEYK